MRDKRIDNVRILANLAICLVHAYPFMYAVDRTVEFWACTFVSKNFCMLGINPRRQGDGS